LCRHKERTEPTAAFQCVNRRFVSLDASQARIAELLRAVDGLTRTVNLEDDDDDAALGPCGACQPGSELLRVLGEAMITVRAVGESSR
jgi:hypothetical protein